MAAQGVANAHSEGVWIAGLGEGLGGAAKIRPNIQMTGYELLCRFAEAPQQEVRLQSGPALDGEAFTAIGAFLPADAGTRSALVYDDRRESLMEGIYYGTSFRELHRMERFERLRRAAPGLFDAGLELEGGSRAPVAKPMPSRGPSP